MNNFSRPYVCSTQKSNFVCWPLLLAKRRRFVRSLVSFLFRSLLTASLCFAPLLLLLWLTICLCVSYSKIHWHCRAGRQRAAASQQRTVDESQLTARCNLLAMRASFFRSILPNSCATRERRGAALKATNDDASLLAIIAQHSFSSFSTDSCLWGPLATLVFSLLNGLLWRLL